jgi:hypothetical protein
MDVTGKRMPGCVALGGVLASSPVFIGYEKLSRAFFAEFKGPIFSSKKRHDHDGFSESKGVNPTWPAGL